jgi:hypothetical protein
MDKNQSLQRADEAAAQQSNTVSMFERLAKDPTVDVAKLERLMDLKERADARNAEQLFNAAMATAQTDMRPVAADSDNPQTRSKYASYSALDRALRPVYTRNGFALSFGTADGAPPEYVRVTCHVSHIGGHSRDYRIDMPADGKGAKGGDVMTKTHATGSATSYGMRYLLKMIFNVAVGEDDDDGNGAGAGAAIDENQAVLIHDLIKDAGSTTAKFLAYLNTEHKMALTRVEDMPAKVYPDALASLKGAIAAHQRKTAPKS